MEEKNITIGELRRFLSDNKELSDDVGIYYPYYYKGYGLMPVRTIEKGIVSEENVVVLDWDFSLHNDGCFIKES